MLLLLNLNDGAVLESPLDNIGLLAGALDVLRGAEGRPELGEVLDLDEVPDVGERGWSIACQPLHLATMQSCLR